MPASRSNRDRYDELLKRYADEYGLDWRLLKRQMLAESGGNARAVSPRGAKGLMQFMPGAWWEWGQGDPFDPEASIRAGAAYMKFLLSRFEEIPDDRERYKFALAAYNAGRANINRCLEYARQATGAPSSFEEWVKAGKPPGPWQEWKVASEFLSMVSGRNAVVTIRYVEQIMGELE